MPVSDKALSIVAWGEPKARGTKDALPGCPSHLPPRRHEFARPAFWVPAGQDHLLPGVEPDAVLAEHVQVAEETLLVAGEGEDRDGDRESPR